MRFPAVPKPYIEIFQNLKQERLSEILGKGRALELSDRYLPWNEFRRRPVPDGLSHEEAWFLIKLKRHGNLREIPLLDKKGHPFLFALPNKLIEQLHNIDCGLGANWNVPDAVSQVSTRNEYLASSLMEEAITSSQLEGAVTTREVAKEMLRSGRPPSNKSERMILNNFGTMQRIMAVRKEKLTPELVFQLHALVTDKTLDEPNAAGRFRQQTEKVLVSDNEGTVFHEPPLARELAGRMEKMCAFANGETPDFFIHPVIRGIILHFWLAYDHPFVDGNGRTARALFYWSMLHQDFKLFEFVSISHVLLKAPIQYAESFLYTETDENDLTYFILHQSSVLERAAEALHAYVDSKKASLLAAAKVLREIPDLNHRQKSILTHGVKHPNEQYTIAGHQRSHGVVYETARSDLLDLANRGLLRKSRTGKAIIFRSLPNIGESRMSADSPIRG